MDRRNNRVRQQARPMRHRTPSSGGGAAGSGDVDGPLAEDEGDE
jgi:hypothetical protein